MHNISFQFPNLLNVFIYKMSIWVKVLSLFKQLFRLI